MSYAFISYVREDRERVERLQRILEGAGISVWRDTESLFPGHDWRDEIRRAIVDSELAFIACFSEHTNERLKSYQNEELTVAAEQIRLSKPDRFWLCPVRFADCEIPAFELRPGRTIRDIQRIDLFDGDWEPAIPRLLRSVLSASAGSQDRAGNQGKDLKSTGQQTSPTVQIGSYAEVIHGDVHVQM